MIVKILRGATAYGDRRAATLSKALATVLRYTCRTLGAAAYEDRPDRGRDTWRDERSKNTKQYLLEQVRPLDAELRSQLVEVALLLEPERLAQVVLHDRRLEP